MEIYLTFVAIFLLCIFFIAFLFMKKLFSFIDKKLSKDEDDIEKLMESKVKFMFCFLFVLFVLIAIVLLLT